MKTNDFILKKVTLILFTILLVSFFSCSTEDDGEDLPDEPTEIRFQIDLVKMYATDIKSGEGGRLELRGNINSSIISNGNVTLEEQLLWERSFSNPEYVTFEDTILGSRATFIVELDYKDYSYFQISGKMIEVDSTPGNLDEFMGEVETEIDLLSITDTEEFKLEFKESGGQHVEVVYRITRL